LTWGLQPAAVRADFPAPENPATTSASGVPRGRQRPLVPAAELPETSVTLLNRLQNPHDQEAWEPFLHLYGPLLREWIRVRGLSLAAAEDIVQ
jgi:hypothetical protein